ISPAAPGPSRPPPLEGFAAQRGTPAPLLAAADGPRAGQFLVGGGDGAVASPEAEALPTTLAGGGRGAGLPPRATPRPAAGAAFRPGGRALRAPRRAPAERRGGQGPPARLLAGVRGRQCRPGGGDHWPGGRRGRGTAACPAAAESREVARDGPVV